MKKYFILLIIILFTSCSEYKGEKDNIDYDSVEITFIGYNYEIDDKLKISITNSSEVEKLNHLKNQSKLKWLGLPDKGTEFFIRLVYLNSNTKEKLLISISKSTDSNPTIEYGSGTLFNGKYKNEELTNYVVSLIKQSIIDNTLKQ